LWLVLGGSASNIETIAAGLTRSTHTGADGELDYQVSGFGEKMSLDVLLVKQCGKDDISAQEAAYDACKTVLFDLVSWIYTQAVTDGQCTYPIIGKIDPGRFSHERVGPVADGYYGWKVRIYLRASINKNITFDPVTAPPLWDVPEGSVAYFTGGAWTYEQLNFPTADGTYSLTITDGVKSWSAYSPTGAVVINKTLAQFLALAADGDLQFPATYKITDVQNGMFVETLSASTYDRNTLLSLNCPKTYATTTLDGNVWKGIWRSSKTANVNDLFIWGGVVWKNKTGNIGSATDIVTLDSTNWDYINRNSFSNNEYIPLLLKCQYDFEEEWVNLLADEHGNIIGVDWHINELYGFTYNPAERTDWNCMTKPDVIFSNNQLDCIYNNLGNVISNKINGFIYNNDGNVSDNKYLSVIANNEQDVYENIGADYDIDGAVNEVNNVNGSSFFFTHNFSDSPLTSGNSALYNFIPQDAILTSLSISAASLNGSSIDIGVETDNESAVSLPTALLNGTNTNADVYVVATANRSLSITANGGNITAGTITIKAQFKI
jgi:hypothetical protein